MNKQQLLSSSWVCCQGLKRKDRNSGMHLSLQEFAFSQEPFIIKSKQKCSQAKKPQSWEESSTLMRQFLASWFQSAVLAKLQRHASGKGLYLFIYLFTFLFIVWNLVIKILTLIFSSYWNSLNIKQICGVITGVTRTKDRKISVYMSQQFEMGY